MSRAIFGPEGQAVRSWSLRHATMKDKEDRASEKAGQVSAVRCQHASGIGTKKPAQAEHAAE